MGQVSPAKNVSVLEAVRNTFVTLSREDSPRERTDDPTRKLDVQSVTGTSHQVACGSLLGVSGYISNLSLAALEVPAVREYSDAEWFDLRVLFAATPTARAGILLVESVGSFGIGKHISDLLRNSIRTNIDPAGVIVRVEPVQEALTLGQSIADLETQSIEFRTLFKSDDTAENALGGKAKPYSKVVKISRRGGLGRFAQFKGKGADEISSLYGFCANDEFGDDTSVVANVVMPNGRPRKVNVEEGTPSSISFPIERSTQEQPPSDEEFYKAAIEVVEEVQQGVGLGSLTIVDPSTQSDVNSFEDLQLDWTVTDETPTS
jgi:hypothetical protein